MAEQQSTLNISLRPARFEDVIGHEKIVAAIRKQIDSERVPVAWLFSGPPGVGKTTLARILARYIQGPTFSGDPDVRELNAADTNGVEDIRELARTAGFCPMQGTYKVYILDEAQRLTEPAQNVLLKEFEKKSSTIWIICTTDPGKLIKPLRDRCLSFGLTGLDAKDRKHLIGRALLAVTSDKTVKFPADLETALEAVDVTSPREILLAVEKYVGGIPATEAVQNADAQPEYFEIAKAVASGSWTKTAELLKKLKAAEVRGLRAVVASYLKSMLLNADTPERADPISECLVGLVQLNALEDGVAFAGTVASLYRCCRKLRGAK